MPRFSTIEHYIPSSRCETHTRSQSETGLSHSEPHPRRADVREGAADAGGGRGQRKNKFDILVSEDGATWTVLGITMFSSGARLNAGGTTTWNSLTEVDIYAMPLP